MSRLASLPFAVLSALFAAAPVAAADWPQWRGPHGDGVSGETGLPLHWSEDSGVLWKQPLDGPGSSSPAVAAGAVFVTTQEGDDLYLLKFDAATGRPELEAEGRQRRHAAGADQQEDRRRAPPSEVPPRCKTWPARRPPPTARWSSPTSATAKSPPTTTPASASGIATCRTTTAPTPSGGATPTAPSSTRTSSSAPASRTPSPTCRAPVGELPAGPRQAHRRAQMEDGAQDEIRGRGGRRLHHAGPVRRPAAARNWSSMGGNQLDAYDPDNGRQLWYLPGLVGGRTVGGPTVGDGLVFATRGKKGPMVAVKPEGEGELPRQGRRLDRRQGHARQLLAGLQQRPALHASWTPASPTAMTATPAI